MEKEKFIRLTKKTIEEIFDDCNNRYFNNEIPKPKVIALWTPRKRTIGMVRPLYNKKTERYSSALHISKIFKWTEKNLRKVIIHEMIHLYIGDYLRPLTWWERIFPFLLKEHDNDFIKVMEDLNERFDLDISVRFPEMKKYYR